MPSSEIFRVLTSARELCLVTRTHSVLECRSTLRSIQSKPVKAIANESRVVEEEKNWVFSFYSLFPDSVTFL